MRTPNQVKAVFCIEPLAKTVTTTIEMDNTEFPKHFEQTEQAGPVSIDDRQV